MNLDEQLTKYLTDAHSIEEQALPQMRAAPDLASDPELERIFREHETETEEHERMVRARLEARDAAPSKLKDIVARATAFPFVLFAKSQPDTTGKLVAHAHSYEALELAAYEMLLLVADRAGDTATAEVARAIADQERAMRDRLAANFDRAVEASIREKDVDGEALGDHVVKYLTDAHAIEAQAIQLLERGPKIAGDPELALVYEEHLEETRSQQRRVAAQLDARNASPSRLKDAAMRLGGLNWGGFFQAQPDTPAKLAGFAFAFEHLEIAGYEELRCVAERAGDSDTAAVAAVIAGEERAAAERIRGLFDRAVDASLDAQGATA
jgi:ferritin-like metal-binding protein YciE